MTTAGIAYIELRAKLDQFERDLRGVQGTTQRAAVGMERSWRSSLGRVAGGMKTFGNRATIGLTAPLLLAGRTAMQSAKEAALGQAELESVIKATGGAANVTVDEINAMAQALAKTTLHEDDAVVAGAAMLATFKNVRNEVGEGNDIFNQSVGVLADMSAFMKTDMKSSAIQLGKALNEPALAASALSRTGAIAKTEVAELQEMAENGAPVLEQQAYLLNAIKTQIGGVAEAQAKTDAGKQIQGMKELNETMEDLGTTLGPVMADLADALIPLLRGFSDLPGPVKTAMIALGLGIGPIARLTGGIISLTTATKAATAATAATTAAQTGAAASSVGLAAKLGAVAAAAAPVAGVLAVGAGAYIGLKKVTDETIKAEDLHRESMNDSFALGMEYWDAVQAGRMTIADYRVKMEQLASAEGVAATEAVQLLATARRLSDSFARSRSEANRLTFSVNALEASLRSIPSNTPVRVTYEQIGNPVAAPGTIRARAMGGAVSARQTYLVGERGPEILTMGSRSGHITPNHSIGGTVVVNINGGNPLETERAVDNALRKAGLRSTRYARTRANK